MRTFLTKEQRQRLQAASSGVYGDERENLTDEQIEETTKKINQVLFDLHQENHQAFSTLPSKDLKGNYTFVNIYLR